MSDIQIKILDNSDLVRKALRSQIEQALIAIGMEGEANAITEVNRAVYDTPPSPTYVRTGRLRNSLTNQVNMNDYSVIIGTVVEYAHFVELGTTRMPPRPYLRPAILNYQDKYRSLAIQALS